MLVYTDSKTTRELFWRSQMRHETFENGNFYKKISIHKENL